MLFQPSNFYFAVRSLVAATVVCSFGCASHLPTASPFSADETNQALAPAKQLRPRCYKSSALAQTGKNLVLDFKLEVEPSGAVRAIPTFAEPDAPEVIECVRRELNAIRFPARGRDRLVLHFEMGR